MVPLNLSRFHPSVVGLLLLLALVAFNYRTPLGYLVSASVLAVVVWSSVSQLMRKHGKSFPRNPTVFFSPFGSTEEEAKTIWKREDRKNQLIAKISAAGTTNIIVTGPSGAGKSTLLYNIVFKELSERPFPRYVTRRIENYNDFRTNIAVPILSHLPEAYHAAREEFLEQMTQFISRTRLGIEDVYRLAKAKAARDLEREDDPGSPKQALDKTSLTPKDLATLSDLERDSTHPVDRHRVQELAFRLWERFEALASEALENPDKGGRSGDYLLFAFDQLERLILNARAALASEARQDTADYRTQGQEAFNGYEFFFVLQTFKLLRKAPTVRTVFVLRSEYIYSIYEIVESLVNDSDRPKLPNGTGNADGAADRQELLRRDEGFLRARSPVTELFLCPGINSEELDAFAEVERSFKGLAKSSNERASNWPDISGKWDSFVKVCQMNNRSQSNTFIVQLFGYLLEVLGNNKDVQAILQEERDRKHILSTFFDYLIADFIAGNGISKGSSSGSQMSRSNPHIMLTILYAVAVENRVAGQAISPQRIQALSHVPEDLVREVIQYLQDLKILSAELDAGRTPHFRIVHEQLSDYIIESERFKLDGRTKDGIRGLSEIRTPTSAMVRPKRLHDPLTDLYEAPNIGVLSIWIFNVYGLILTLSPQFCTATEPLFANVWLSQRCELMQPLYWARFIMESSWVAYIYVLSMAAFIPTASSRMQKILAGSLPVVGSVLGIVFSHSPVLFLGPLCTVGFLMTAHLLLGKAMNEYKGKYADECFRWGYRTGLNMSFTMLLMGATYIILFAPPEDAENLLRNFHPDLGLPQVQLGWVVLSNAFMLWFLLHIYPDQASSDQIIRRLVEFDRTRTDRLENRETA